MITKLTDQQEKAQAGFKNFVDMEVVPVADAYEREERVCPDLIKKLAGRGYLGAVLPSEYGGGAMSMVTCGILHEEVGRGCSSLRSLLTVHGMVSLAILRWGSQAQRAHWLPLLARGDALAAFALTEPNAGSDSQKIATRARRVGDSYALDGRKKWITFGQIADVFLVFAQCEGKATAFLVEKNCPGLTIKPIHGMLGVRASMLAELVFEDCRVPRVNLIGREGTGVSYVAAAALDFGRYTVACGCVGIGQASLEASLEYAAKRRQFDAYLKDHQLIRQMLTGMVTNVKAARLLCQHAGYLKDQGAPEAIMETSIAKYFASKMATRAASDAVQIHGANGCSSEYPVQRYLRDAKVMEIIEGSTQIQEITIAQYSYQEFGA